ncbi:Zinc finger, GRF-type [Sesbania bispinosa]|nr:Zinc finger, GRF-type [Sesbania bispinosa]
MKGATSCSQKRSVRCNSSSSSSNPRGRRCMCGEKLLFLTSNTSTNPGRNFWRCPLWNTESSCNYFKFEAEASG